MLDSNSNQLRQGLAEPKHTTGKARNYTSLTRFIQTRKKPKIPTII